MTDEEFGNKVGDLPPEWTTTPEQRKAAQAGVDNTDTTVGKTQDPESKNQREHSFADLMVQLESSGYDQEKLSEIVRPENVIGHGGNADVYAIPGVEKYVMRIVRAAGGEINGQIQEVQDDFPEYNIGQAVAGIPEAGVYFLRRQPGVPAGVPYGEIRRASGEASDKVYEDHLRNAASMPQEAYDDFIKMLSVINERGYQFDPSKANNVLLDLEAGKFNVVDINKKLEGSTYQNSISELVITLMDNAYSWKYKGSGPVENYRRVILEKCTEAARKAGQTLPTKGKNSSLDFSFKLAGMER